MLLTKEKAKSKAQTLKALLKEFNHDVKIGHCYEIIAKQNGFDSWNAMAAGLETLNIKPTSMEAEPCGGCNSDPCQCPEDFYPTLEALEKNDQYLFEVVLRARADVKRELTVQADNPREAYLKVQQIVEEAEGDYWSGEDWEVDSHIGIENHFLDVCASINEDRDVMITDIHGYSSGIEVCHIQEEGGIKEDDSELEDMNRVHSFYLERNGESDRDAYIQVKKLIKSLLGDYASIGFMVDVKHLYYNTYGVKVVSTEDKTYSFINKYIEQEGINQEDWLQQQEEFKKYF